MNDQQSFEVVRGDPDDEEVAAMLVVLAAVLADPGPARPNTDRPIAGGWNSHWRGVRQPFIHGPQAWSGSLRRD